jgi:uncharacterized membrane protein YeaQ/YmgE (transglycosylase-associated protein family)
MEFLYFILIGLAAGWLAGYIMASGFGLIGDLVVGVVGGLLGGFIFGQLGLGPTNILGAIIAATAGACLLIAILRFIKRKT